MFGRIIDALKILLGFLNFGKWFTTRKGERAEKANKTEAVSRHDQNARDINSDYH